MCSSTCTPLYLTLRARVRGATSHDAAESLCVSRLRAPEQSPSLPATPVALSPIYLRNEPLTLLSLSLTLRFGPPGGLVRGGILTAGVARTPILSAREVAGNAGGMGRETERLPRSAPPPSRRFFLLLLLLPLYTLCRQQLAL